MCFPVPGHAANLASLESVRLNKRTLYLSEMARAYLKSVASLGRWVRVPYLHRAVRLNHTINQKLAQLPQLLERGCASPIR